MKAMNTKLAVLGLSNGRARRLLFISVINRAGDRTRADSTPSVQIYCPHLPVAERLPSEQF